jgi:diguanylate cyclase (GGDEF)-like protein
VDDYQVWEGRMEHPAFNHLGGVIGLPLLSNGKVVGVCVIRNAVGWGFTEEEKLLLTRFIGLVSIAYDNALLYKLAQEEISERKSVEEKLRYMSMHDSLTGLYNRTYFAEEMKRIAEGGYSCIGIIVADIDGLKRINDTLGHIFGDDLIMAAGALLQTYCRKNDVVARIGGDEFVIFLPEVDKTVVEDICQGIKNPLACYQVPSIGECLRLSVGWAVSNDHGRDIYERFKEADANMYLDKISNKGKKT